MKYLRIFLRCFLRNLYVRIFNRGRLKVFVECATKNNFYLSFEVLSDFQKCTHFGNPAEHKYSLPNAFLNLTRLETSAFESIIKENANLKLQKQLKKILFNIANVEQISELPK